MPLKVASVPVLGTQGVKIRIRWRAEVPEALRDRIERELESASWCLSELEALLLDAHRVTGMTHAWLAPSFDVRLPLFDAGRRLRLAMTRLDTTRLALLDEDGHRLADVRLE